MKTKSRQVIKKYDHNCQNEALERWQMNQDPLAHLSKSKTKKLEESFAILAEDDDHFSHQTNNQHYNAK